MSQSQPFHLFQPLLSLPAPTTLTNFWSLGSILGASVFIQVLSGFFLSIFYHSSVSLAFSSVIHTQLEVTHGWLSRAVHSTGASIVFFLIFLHISRGLYFNSFRSTAVWLSGWVLLLGFIGTAFLGYVLPWGQISFWGATVITSLITTVPFVGEDLVSWIWGGFSVSEPTLSRFFSLHFILPLAILLVIVLHILALHTQGSSNPLGLGLSLDNVPFHPYFSFKDLTALVLTLSVWVLVSLTSPWITGDADNFIPANPISTPEHIKPEWYFLFAYAILRSIPSKLGGVLGLLSSLLVLAFIAASPISTASSGKPSTFKLSFWSLGSSWMVLSFLGAIPVEYPFIILSQVFGTIYFISFLALWAASYRCPYFPVSSSQSPSVSFS